MRLVNNFVLQMAILCVSIFQYLMLFRAIASWFPQMQGGRLYGFIYGFTEPVILPFRKLLQRFQGLRGFPLDLSFLLAYMALVVIEMLLRGMY